MKHLPLQMSPCIHFGDCGGCTEHLNPKPPPVWLDVSTFFTPLFKPVFNQGSPFYWRHRAKMAVRGSCQQPLIGLFRKFSHDVHPIPFCLVHHPLLNQAFEKARQWIKKHSFVPYQELSGLGELRYLQGVVERKSGRVQLAFVLNFSNQNELKFRHYQSLIQKLGEEFPVIWHSLWINFNDQMTNTIFGPRWSFVWGEKELWENFNGVDVCYGPASFGQANLPLFEKMLSRIKQLLLEKACVAEFYGGVGAIGLVIASKCQWVRISEINPYAETYFNQSCLRLSSTISSRLSFLSAPIHKSFSILKDSTTVIVDPPRKGLDSRFFPALKEHVSVKQLLYISCGWEAFKHDYEKLCADGWKAQTVDGYHFFPGSNHVELLVNFIR